MANGLKKKWLLTLPDSSGYLPPGSRHKGSVVGTSTDNNSAMILLEGDAYLKAWHDEISDLKKQPAGAALYHSGQRIDNVVTLGHSKVAICDDEFVLLGTASITQRGLTSASEIAVGIDHQNNTFAKSLRSTLWAGHLGLTSSSKAEGFNDTYVKIKSATTTKPQGHLVPYGATDSISGGQKKT